MKIQLKSWNVVSMNFNLLEEDSKREENSFDLETGNLFPEENSDTFGVGFKITIKDKSFDLFVEANFDYQLENEITEEFKLSSFPKVNAPAIAFPYLRAFISNLTLQAGIEPVILPSINFVKLSED